MIQAMAVNNSDFMVGARVRHRASGRLAIITVEHCVCLTHESGSACESADLSDCQMEPTGLYDVSLDFGDEHEIRSVPGYLLEAAESER